MKKFILLISVIVFNLSVNAQLFDGKFINPDEDSVLLSIEPEQTVVLDTFSITSNDVPYVGIIRLTTPVSKLYQFDSGQVYTIYNDNNDGELRTRWLGWITPYFYRGNTVMRDSEGTRFWIVKYNSIGFPYRHVLPENTFNHLK